MNIDKLPSPGKFSGCVKLSKEVSQAISSVEINYNWGSTKEAETLREFFSFCVQFLDETILEKSKEKKKTKKE